MEVSTMLWLGTCGYFLIAFLILSYNPVRTRDVHVGSTWRIDMRWSGYGIASEDRKDGGHYFVRVTEVHDDGTITLEGPPNIRWNGAPARGNTYAMLAKHVYRIPSRASTGAYSQCLHYYGERVADTKSLSFGGRGEADKRFSECLERGGLAAIRQYNR